MICPHCGEWAPTPVERLRASRLRRGLCLDCPSKTEDGCLRCLRCRLKKNARTRAAYAKAKEIER